MLLIPIGFLCYNVNNYVRKYKWKIPILLVGENTAMGMKCVNNIMWNRNLSSQFVYFTTKRLAKMRDRLWSMNTCYWSHQSDGNISQRSNMVIMYIMQVHYARF